MDSKILRSCISCGENGSSDIFTYTYDFMRDVREVPADIMEEIGWTKDITSTIVKCDKCGCDYIKDVFPNYERDTKKAPTQEKVSRVITTYKKFPSYDEENWIFRNLIFRAVRENKRDVRFLDFGAGSGRPSNTARSYGVRDVVAYDPYSAYGHKEYKMFNFPGIVFTRSREDIDKLGPFDVVVCQGVIEHTLDPKGDLKAMYKNMSPGAYLYISNPLMDLSKEKKKLFSAKSIKKSDKISHYHPGHINYLTPGRFTKLLREAGFQVTSMQFSPPVSLAFRLDRKYLIRDIKSSIMRLLCIFGIPYRRYMYIARKPR